MYLTIQQENQVLQPPSTTRKDRRAVKLISQMEETCWSRKYVGVTSCDRGHDLTQLGHQTALCTGIRDKVFQGERG